MVERIGVETVAYQKSLAQELRRLSLLPIININELSFTLILIYDSC